MLEMGMARPGIPAMGATGRSGILPSSGRSVVSLAMLVGMTALTTMAAPVVSDVTFSQGGSSRTVEIRYTLSGAPAIVTLDILTNATSTSAGASIGAGKLKHVSGEVFKEVAVDGTYTLRWEADADWPGRRITDESVRAKVIARPVDNPPDYMVVATTLVSPATRYEVRYYDEIETVTTDEFRGDKLVLKRVHAPECGYYPMGNLSETGHRVEERLHFVNLTEDYYLGVFELTKKQFDNIGGGAWAGKFTADRDYRPQENATINSYRGGTIDTAPVPTDASILGKLSLRTDYAFDLPSATQFEYALRAGNYEGYWPNGVAIDTVGASITAWTDETNLLAIARFAQNAYPGPNGTGLSATTPPAEGGTAIVGSYAPNNLGFYDMLGNVNEFCLDYYKADNSASDGSVTPLSQADDTSKLESRGGCYWDQWYNMRPSRREGQAYSSQTQGTTGIRVCCPIVRRR